MKVIVWERVDRPSKGYVYQYKRGERQLKESNDEYYVLLNGFRAYVDYTEGQTTRDVFVRYYVKR
jgi:hypothetical protein